MDPASEKKIEEEDLNEELSAWALVWDLGFQIVITFVGFALLGFLADEMLGTSPWLLVAGIVLASVVSTVIIYRRVTRLLK